jgi:hypothetical protein
MPHVKGTPKTPGSGRKKGSTNKVALKTLVELQAYLESQGVSPFTVLINTMRTTSDEKLKVVCAIALADRLLPKLKAVEISGDPDRPLTFTDATARQARIAALLEKSTNGTH